MRPASAALTTAIATFPLRAVSSFGLAGMRERARLLGGSFRVDSEPGRGSRFITEFAMFGGRKLRKPHFIVRLH